MSFVPLAEHALLADCGAAGLVTAGGSVDWLALPRFDSAPVFARLLDEAAGHFSIAPVDAGRATSRGYLPRSLVLRTVWETATGTLELTDALALTPEADEHDLGASSPGVLLRRAVCTAGAVRVHVEYAPRPEFGLISPVLEQAEGVLTARGGPTVLCLAATQALEVDGATARAVVGLTQGQELCFALRQFGAWDREPWSWDCTAVPADLEATTQAWRDWSGLHQSYSGPHRELVAHSGLVLQGLTCARTGALIAAATTSLPEGVGSGRTWDYRFTWVRDASLTMQGLFVAACPREAGLFFDFLATAAGSQLERGEHLQPVFGVGAERDLSERELGHLSGWRDSGPVRAGNDAWRQYQLDVYGALLDAAWTLREQLGELREPARRLLVAAADAAAEEWTRDDQGIWEMRGPARPFLHSKLMCWVAVNRALAMRDLLAPDERRVEAWSNARVEIAAAILTDGWNDKVGAFTQFFGSVDLDASVLLLATTGFLEPDDPRLLATIDAVEAALSDERGLLRRYVGDDGLPGEEGSFLLCTFWLAHALAVTGQTDRASDVLDRAAGYANDLGLFAEQVESRSGELLGNFPQAFSHLGLVTAAAALADAVARTSRARP